MPVAFGVTIIVFFMIHLIPGDPARTILGIHATPQAIAILHREWGLNRPLISQYWLFLDRLVHGNLGQSLYYGGSAGSLILGHLPATLWLIIYAAVLAVLISVPLAMIAASRKDGIRDHVVRAVPLVGLGMPLVLAGDPADLRVRHQLPAVPGQRLRHRLRRPPALDVPAQPDRRDRAVRRWSSAACGPACSTCSAPTTSPRPGPRASPASGCSSGTCCATRSSRRSRCSASTSAS